MDISVEISNITAQPAATSPGRVELAGENVGCLVNPEVPLRYQHQRALRQSSSNHFLEKI